MEVRKLKREVDLRINTKGENARLLYQRRMEQARKRQTVATKQNGGYPGAGDERAKCETVASIRMGSSAHKDGNARPLHKNRMGVIAGRRRKGENALQKFVATSAQASRPQCRLAVDA